MSFTSASMAFGAWPTRVKMCEPTINAALYFDTCPTVEGLKPMVDVFSTYERCAGVPEGSPGKADWRVRFVDFKPEDMIRTIKVKNEVRLRKRKEKSPRERGRVVGSGECCCCVLNR